MPKAYTKFNVIREVAKVNGLSKQKSTETVNTLLDIIKRTLESEVSIRCFSRHIRNES